jgi:3-hydroxyacyl-[acyl-carrier-protein] dehydratase
MVLDRAQIERLIPHRAPFLWVDEVVELGENRLKARKRVDPQLDVFAGHYPQFAVLPGVLLCEAAFQAGAILIASTSPPAAGQVPVVTRVNNVKFRRMVRPGELLDIEVELTEQLGGAYFLTGRVSVESETAVRLEFACAAVAA